MSEQMLTVRNVEWMGDWYVIEWADHDGREWLDPTEYGASLMRSASRMRSARPSDADIEGCASEMLAIAGAIESRSTVEFHQCAVTVDGDIVSLCSPRNSTVDANVSLAVADALAVEIRKVCAVEVAP